MACAKNVTRRSFFLSLIVASFALLSGRCNATTHGTEVIKPAFFFSPLAYCTFQSLYQEKKHTDNGFRFQMTPFYSKNFSKNLVAAGLGASETASFTVAPKSLTPDVDSDHLIAVLTKNLGDPILQRIDETTVRPRATITLAPEQKELGLSITIRHDLDFLVDGLFYSLEVSWVRQTRALNAVYSDEHINKISTADIITIHEFFNGVSQSIYDPLKSLKLSNQAITKEGFESVQATIGYNILDKNDFRIAVIASAQLPCGPKHDLEYLFSPNIGLKHLQLGLGWHGYLKIGGNEQTAWYISNHAMGGYSFPADEPRIPTILGMPWGHYQQMYLNETPAYYTATPGADMLPQSIKVKQGLSLQDSFILSYKHNDLRVEAGFSAAYREAEHNILSKPWEDNTTAIPNRYINPYNFTGASNNLTPPAFTTDAKMYPATTGRLPESLPYLTTPSDLTHGRFLIGTREMVPVTSGAWGQKMTTKIINNEDLELNMPTVFRYQIFGSIAKKFTFSPQVDGTMNFGGQITFGEPRELMMRNYQLWIGLGLSF